MKKLLKKIAATALATIMTLSMGTTTFAASGDVYAKFCKNGKGPNEISMTQLAVDGKATVTVAGNGEVQVTVPLDGFKKTVLGITAIGYLQTLTIGNNTYNATYTTDTDGDGYLNGSITFKVPSASYKVDDTSTYVDAEVEADLTVLDGIFEKEMTKDVDLYFSSTQPVYNG